MRILQRLCTRLDVYESCRESQLFLQITKQFNRHRCMPIRNHLRYINSVPCSTHSCNESRRRSILCLSENRLQHRYVVRLVDLSRQNARKRTSCSSTPSSVGTYARNRSYARSPPNLHLYSTHCRHPHTPRSWTTWARGSCWR